MPARGLFDELDRPHPPLRAMTIAFSSAGCCALVQAGDTCVLVDAGISVRRVQVALAPWRLSLKNISAILLTHAHGDHIGRLDTVLAARSMPVWATSTTLRHVADRLQSIPGAPELIGQPLTPRKPFAIGAIEIEAVRTSHDISGSVAYSFTAGGRTLGLLTDLGTWDAETVRLVQSADALILETNYDVGMLKDGSYPPAQKLRILGNEGHLSNVQAAELIVAGGTTRLKRVLCAHLSAENNTPEKVLATMSSAAAACPKLAGVKIVVAPREEPSDMFEV